MANLNTDQFYDEVRGKEAVAQAMFADLERISTPNQRAAQELQKRQSAKEQPPKILEDLAVTPASSTQTEAAIDKVVGFKWKDTGTKDAAGNPIRIKERDTSQKAAFNAARREVEFVNVFLKNGYSNLAETDGTKLAYTYVDSAGATKSVTIAEYLQDCRQRAFDTIKAVWPNAGEVIGRETAETQKRMLDKMLRDPEFAKHMKARLEEIISGAQEPKSIPQEVLDAVRKTKLEYDTKLKEEQWASDDLTKKKDELRDEYETIPPKAGTKGEQLAKMKPLAVLEANKKAAEKDVENKQLAFDAAQAAYNDIKNTRGADPIDVNEARRELVDARDAFTKAQAKLNTAIAALAARKELEEYKVKLQDEIRRLQQELDKKQLERQTAETAYFDALATKDERELELGRSEASFLSKLKGVEGEAVRKYLQAELGKYEVTREEILKEHGDDALAQGLQDRWNKKNKRNEFNKSTIESDFKTFINKGDQGLTEIVVKTLVAGGMSEKEARAKIVNDKEFATKAKGDVVERLLTRRLQTGGINEGEARRIIDMPGGEDAIENAIAARAKYNGTLEKLKEEGLLKGEFVRKLKKLSNNRLVQVLMLLLGVGGLLAVDAMAGLGVANFLGVKAAEGATYAGNKVLPFAGKAASSALDKATVGLDAFKAAT